MTRPVACRLAGLDPDVVAMCDAAERRQLAMLARLYALPPLVCAAAGAVLGAVALGSTTAAFVLGASALLVTGNVVRLLVAGSGLPPESTDAEAAGWRPGARQLVSLGLWVGIQAPVPAAWLLLVAGWLDEPLAEWRLLHEQFVGAAAAGPPGLTALLVIAGQRPAWWLGAAALLAAVGLSPCIHRLVRGRAVASYARRLRAVQRTHVLHEWRRHREAMGLLLAPHRRRGTPPLLGEWFADPPFCREPIPPHPAAFDRVRTAAELPLPFAGPGR